MFLKLLALLGGLSVPIGVEMVKKMKIRALPDISDEEFVRIFRETCFDLADEIILRERQYIAEVLEIPPCKLSPLQTLAEISKCTKISLSAFLGPGDLLSDYYLLLEEAGIEKPKDYVPSTIGEFIYDLATAKKIIEDRQ